jgi:hypothetical protein
MNFIESTVDVDYYIEKADIKYLTAIEVRYIVEYFEFVGESVSDAVEALDLNVAECIEDATKLLKTFKELQQTNYDA